MSGTNVAPWRVNDGIRTRGSPVGGASTSSSSATPKARASGSSSSRVGLRPPDSSRDSVESEIPVDSARSVRVMLRAVRSARSREPTPSSTVVKSSTLPL